MDERVRIADDLGLRGCCAPRRYQSDHPVFSIARLDLRAALKKIARGNARLTLARDPELTGDQAADGAAVSVRAG